MAQRLSVTHLTGLSPRHAAFLIEYVKDFAPRRAAQASGFSPDSGYELLKREDINAVLYGVLQKRLEASDIDAEWALMEAVDNHNIARQVGNITASNTALGLVFKHKFVEAMAAEKVEVNSDRDVMDRLLRGRKRRKEAQDNDNKEDISFL